jgi:hypothetical protein
LNTAVLFLVFNRPDTTKKVFSVICEVKPPRLYIAADGPRASKVGEEALCNEVRDIIHQIDWPCKVKTLFRKENLGCKVAISQGIDWFFEQETEGIIIEDDCLPDKSFFPYCEELLERYREDTRISIIGGNCFDYNRRALNESYYFTRHVEIWGWATWKRTWNAYDVEMKDWPKVRKTNFLLEIGSGSPHFQMRWRSNFQSCYNGEIDTWDFQLVYSIFKANGLSVLPKVNLVSNIGYSKDATRTKESNPLLDKIPLQALQFPLVHPDIISRDPIYDLELDRELYNIGVEPKGFLKFKILVKSLLERIFNVLFIA